MADLLLDYYTILILPILEDLKLNLRIACEKDIIKIYVKLISENLKNNSNDNGKVEKVKKLTQN